MKNKNVDVSKKQGVNRLLFIANDREFKKIHTSMKGDFEKSGKGNIKAVTASKALIRDYLVKNNLPENWTDYLYIFITKGDIKFPYREGIELLFEDQRMDERLLILEKDGRIISPKDIRIVITKKVTKTALKKFIDEVYPHISEVQDKLKFPEITPMNKKHALLAMDVIERKKTKTFSAIANDYSNEVSADDPMYVYMCDENNLKTLYYKWFPLFDDNI